MSRRLARLLTRDVHVRGIDAIARAPIVTTAAASSSRPSTPASGACANAARAFASSHARDAITIVDTNTIAVTFIDRDGVEVEARPIIGENLLVAAHAFGVELEGACEGSLACSTCHVVFDSEDVFASLPEACDDENDMLDLAYGLTSTSRLGCQVIATRGAMEGCVVRVPRATRNFAVDGFKPKPH